MDGLHLIADLYDCEPADASLMHEPRALRELCLGLVRESGLSAVAELFHAFTPEATAASSPVAAGSQGLPPVQPACGITGVVLLAESHCAVHTWPEKQAVTLDVYVCNFGADNSAKARQLAAALIKAFAPGRQVLKEIARGGPQPPPG